MRQITERGYPVAEVSQRRGVSQHSLYEWKKKFVALDGKGSDEREEIKRLKRELARVTEERDILKKSGRILRRGCKVKYTFIACDFRCGRCVGFSMFTRVDSTPG